jgi:hypothetical protein
MPIGTKTNMVINNPFIYTGYTEMLTQFSNAFNEQSGGAIVLSSESKRGEIAEESFFQNVSGLIRERNPASVADIADKELNQSKLVEVKLNRGVGPVAQTYDAFRKTGQGGTQLPEGHSASGIDLYDMVIGQQTAKGVQVEMVNTALAALTTCLNSQADLKFANLTRTVETVDLVDGLSRMGDAAAQNVGIWVMHSKQFYDLVKQQITANLDGVTGFVVASASPITLNRPVLIIDSPSLVVANGGGAGISTYRALGLGKAAVEAIDSEDMMLASQLITGKDNLAVRLQGEYSYNLGVRGFSYNVAGGGVNPSAAAIATAANWTKSFLDRKDLGGVVVETR